MIIRWLKGILVHRPGRLIGAMFGIGATIALLATLGQFLRESSLTMAARAEAEVAVDWQVAVSAGVLSRQTINAIAATPHVARMAEVRYAEVLGLQASTGGTTQTTGAAKVVGLGPGYRNAFPKVFRQLAGTSGGIELAQQTAANLHVQPGGRVTITRSDGSRATVIVDGVTNPTNADTFFQTVGVPQSAAPQAPPDNVVFVPLTEFQDLFPAELASVDGPITTEFHVMLDRVGLPKTPGAAYTYIVAMGNNLEARSSGRLRIANNLAAHLAAVRSDALYARVLFLFLGLPGVLLSLALTLIVVWSGKRHLDEEQALLRVRGASFGRVVAFESVETVVAAIGGVVVGALVTLVTARILFGTPNIKGGSIVAWLGVSSGATLLVVVGASVLTLRQRIRSVTIASARAHVRTTRTALWRTVYLDLILLAVAAVVYLRTAQSGYQVVLAPEGVPQVSVNYSAFLAPLFLWLGSTLFAIRLFESGLRRGRAAVSTVVRPLAGNLASVVAASVERQSTLISRGILLVALAVAFAVSTAVFNTTYNAQSRVDAQLTNGSDVTVNGSTAYPPSLLLSKIRAVRGVAAAEPMIHRFAYVGNDLQDIYGINPTRIGDATTMSNAYFASGDAARTLALLGGRPNGVLVSEETKNDYQLNVGDNVNLRLQFAGDHQYHVVPFTFVGVVREFPTAPRDSFLVANADYIAKATGSSAMEYVLIRSHDTAAHVASAVERVVAPLPGVTVTSVSSVQRAIGSNLTAISLNGLTRLELLFAVLFVVGATGLVLALGLNERRRNFAILGALGARARQLGSFIWSEGLIVLGGGTIVGTALGFGIASLLVKVLTGVFDPPPEHLAVPLVYLAVLALSAATGTVGAVAVTERTLARPVSEELRRV